MKLSEGRGIYYIKSIYRIATRRRRRRERYYPQDTTYLYTRTLYAYVKLFTPPYTIYHLPYAIYHMPYTYIQTYLCSTYIYIHAIYQNYYSSA